tara:strand:+ start:406 stop:810 length:405 start_codon:yes stop_codon:yes gene_type:complete
VNEGNQLGIIGNLWAKCEGRQLAISATATFAFTLLLCFSLFHLGFMQDTEGWDDLTGLAISLVVFSLIGLFISAPEFLHLKGLANLIDELMEISSSAELRRRMSEGSDAATKLSGGHELAWNSFLEEKGLKKRR